MLQDEEDAVSHRRQKNDNIATGALGTGMSLRVFGGVVWSRASVGELKKDIVALMSLLHDHLGHHEPAIKSQAARVSPIVDLSLKQLKRI